MNLFLRTHDLKFLQKLLQLDQIWADCSKNSKTPFSESHLPAKREALLQHVGALQFSKIRRLPKF